jgi:hypothetical protein
MEQDEPLMQTTEFSSLAEAITAAMYVEQILAAENMLIVNRLSWLFLSQSFCISAFVVLETSIGSKQDVTPRLQALQLAVPILGIICCTLVGLATWAGSFESQRLSNERARLVQYINDRSPTTIPNLGAKARLRDYRWTQYGGSLPNRLLPLILAAFWIVTLVW